MSSNPKAPAPQGDTHYANDPDYKVRLTAANEQGKCMFCQPEFCENQEKVVARSGGWYARLSDYPKKDSEGEYPELYLLIVSDRHVTQLEGLSVNDLRDIHDLLIQLKLQFNVKGWGIAFREGDSRWSGATIFHLHFHVIVPRVKQVSEAEGDVRAVPLYFPIG